MKTLSILLLIILLLSSGTSGQEKPAEVQKLTPGKAVQFEIAGGRKQAFLVTLKSGEFLRAVATSVDIEVVSTLFDPDGQKLLTADLLKYPSAEAVSFEATKPGDYRLEISSTAVPILHGHYELTAEVKSQATEPDRQRMKAEHLLTEAKALDAEGSTASFQKANDKRNEAIAIWRQLGDRYWEAYSIYVIGRAYASLNKRQEAIDQYGQALAIRTEIGDKIGAAATIYNIGLVNYAKGERQKALELYLQAATLSHEIGDKSGEANALNNVGVAYRALGQKQKALDYYQQALVLRTALGDQMGQAGSLMGLGNLQNETGESAKALENFDKAFSIYIAVKSVAGQAGALNNQAAALSNLGEKQKALDLYNKALPLYQAAKDPLGEARALNNIGNIHNSSGAKQTALTFYERALEIFLAKDDRATSAILLNNIGNIYGTLGANQKALGYFDRALPIFEATNDLPNRAITLTNQGNVFDNLGDNQKALEKYNLALPLLREVKDRSSEATTLSNIGKVYDFLGDKQQALGLYEQALAIQREVGDRTGEALTLSNMGVVYNSLGEKQKALEAYNQALMLYRAVGDRPGEAVTLANLMKAMRTGNRRLAIFYGKQAVNKFQELRHAVQGIGKETQQTYLATIQDRYKILADLLIADGRIVEAEQVLAMLKEEEVVSYFRRDPTEVDKLQQRADLTKEEADALKRYNDLAGKITTLGYEFEKLRGLQKKGAKLDDKQQARYGELSKQIDDTNYIFQALLKQFAEEFAKRAATTNDLNEALAWQSKLSEWGPGVAFLYTLVGEDRYRVILITPGAKADGKHEIKSFDLDQKIKEFRAIVQDPMRDPRPLGQELYNILIKPIEKELDGARAKTLLWSLDGNLRLLPFAALWDGTQYFGQKYQNVVITLASQKNLSDRVKSHWRALGLGVTEAKSMTLTDEMGGKRDLNFAALPGVGAELNAIVRNPQSPRAVLPGQILLDAAFNEADLEKQLLQKYQVVHIASHFSLNAGDSTKSFLLLGDGKALSVDRIKNNSELRFDAVDLLTLSACDTAVVEKDSNGKEMEGLGYVAQRNGAKAILATLWRVADCSTSLLMAEFYRLRQTRPGMTKAAAMQLAQAEMRDGKLKPAPGTCGLRDTGQRPAAVTASGPAGAAPNAFVTDPLKPYAHPYFWSPFVLIGNWR